VAEREIRERERREQRQGQHVGEALGEERRERVGDRTANSRFSSIERIASPALPGVVVSAKPVT